MSNTEYEYFAAEVEGAKNREELIYTLRAIVNDFYKDAEGTFGDATINVLYYAGSLGYAGSLKVQFYPAVVPK